MEFKEFKDIFKQSFSDKYDFLVINIDRVKTLIGGEVFPPL